MVGQQTIFFQYESRNMSPGILIEAHERGGVSAFLGWAIQSADQIPGNLCGNSEFKWQSPELAGSGGVSCILRAQG